MNEELERILADQLQSARRRIKVYNRLIKMMPDESMLIEGKEQTEKFVIMLEGFMRSPKKHKKFQINIRRTWSNLVYSVRFYKFFIRRKKK